LLCLASLVGSCVVDVAVGRERGGVMQRQAASSVQVLRDRKGRCALFLLFAAICWSRSRRLSFEP
jgi:hypothetical protein